MIGKIDPNTRGLQVWVKDVYDVNGRTLELPTPGTNMKVYWAGDLSTRSPMVRTICTAINTASLTI